MVENLSLRCRAQNAYEAQRPFWATGFARADWLWGIQLGLDRVERWHKNGAVHRRD
jgi:hypothetical protein